MKIRGALSPPFLRASHKPNQRNGTQELSMHLPESSLRPAKNAHSVNSGYKNSYNSHSSMHHSKSIRSLPRSVKEIPYVVILYLHILSRDIAAGVADNIPGSQYVFRSRIIEYCYGIISKFIIGQCKDLVKNYGQYIKPLLYSLECSSVGSDINTATCRNSSAYKQLIEKLSDIYRKADPGYMHNANIRKRLNNTSKDCFSETEAIARRIMNSSLVKTHVVNPIETELNTILFKRIYFGTSFKTKIMEGIHNALTELIISIKCQSRDDTKIRKILNNHEMSRSERALELLKGSIDIPILILSIIDTPKYILGNEGGERRTRNVNGRNITGNSSKNRTYSNNNLSSTTSDVSNTNTSNLPSNNIKYFRNVKKPSSRNRGRAFLAEKMRIPPELMRLARLSLKG